MLLREDNIRCPNCNFIVDRGRPDQKEYRAYCFVCKKHVTINNAEPVKMKTKADFFVSDFNSAVNPNF